MSSSENMRKYINILKEAQVFDWDEQKKNIIELITNKLSDPSYTGSKGVYSPFYSIITNSNLSGGTSENAGFSDEARKSWRDYFTASPFHHDNGGPWSQISINSNLEKKSKSDGRTYNYYIAVAQDKANVQNFLNGQNLLWQIMKKLSDEKQSPIAYKTHRHLDNFMKHNDSLKVYYYDHTLIDDVKQAVNEWLTKANIKTEARTHDHGVDVEGDDGGSYGELLANHVTKVLFNTIDKNGKKYTPEQYYEWIKTHMDTIIRQVKVGRT